MTEVIYGNLMARKGAKGEKRQDVILAENFPLSMMAGSPLDAETADALADAVNAAVPPLAGTTWEDYFFIGMARKAKEVLNRPEDEYHGLKTFYNLLSDPQRKKVEDQAAERDVEVGVILRELRVKLDSMI